MTTMKITIKNMFLKHSDIQRNTYGQMIILLGVTLAISVFLISSIPSQISSISPTVPQARSSTLLTEFVHIRDTFGYALNYNLVKPTLIGFGQINNVGFDPMDPTGDPGPSIISTDPNMTYYGIDGKYTLRFGLSHAIEQTTNAFNNIELQYDRIFRAQLRNYGFSHLSKEGTVYLVGVTLTLQDDYESIQETTDYQILINERIQ